ncbi:helix-turn-helix domain-containing protein [Streptomyces zhihengii]|uniref:helix-turn-helix domain-containing protein n=1 Tax=Streptomyces zhihengii TaxID=1818004 RepID=UPI0036B037C3
MPSGYQPAPSPACAPAPTPRLQAPGECCWPLRQRQRLKLGAELKKAYTVGASIRTSRHGCERSHGFVHRLLTEAGTTLRTRVGPGTRRRPGGVRRARAAGTGRRCSQRRPDPQDPRAGSCATRASRPGRCRRSAWPRSPQCPAPGGRLARRGPSRSRPWPAAPGSGARGRRSRNSNRPCLSEYGRPRAMPCWGCARTSPAEGAGSCSVSPRVRGTGESAEALDGAEVQVAVPPDGCLAVEHGPGREPHAGHGEVHPGRGDGPAGPRLEDHRLSDRRPVPGTRPFSNTTAACGGSGHRAG